MIQDMNIGLSNKNLENETTKQKNKLRIIRHEFDMVGKYKIPLVKKQDIDLDCIELMNYAKASIGDIEHSYKTLHFFTYDWHYETVYSKPETVMEKLGQYYALLTPDFSLYTEMSPALQIYSTFKNRWCGAFWQSLGARVIPTIEWADEQSYEFCFDGVEVGSVVAVATYRRHDKDLFMKGYNKMLEVLKPSAIICYGEPFEQMQGNIKSIDPFDYKELISKMGREEFMKKYLAGELYPDN